VGDDDVELRRLPDDCRVGPRTVSREVSNASGLVLFVDDGRQEEIARRDQTVGGKKAHRFEHRRERSLDVASASAEQPAVLNPRLERSRRAFPARDGVEVALE
jgi:hypothetical protein